jgi:7,8-dihydroneopterin aldolase/epimerase/oxygenase
MFIIALEDVEFFAYHGYYPEEHILGNKYMVNISVELDEQYYSKENLGTTLNYESLFHILQKMMNKQYRLLETLAEDIHAEVIKLSVNIYSIDVKIRKIHTPIPGMQGNSVVQLKKIYHASI